MTLAASLMFIMCIGYIQFYVGLFFFFFAFFTLLMFLLPLSEIRADV